MEEMWLARDKDGSLWLYQGKPKKYGAYWQYRPNVPALEIDRTMFPEVQWEDDEPTKVELVIKR